MAVAVGIVFAAPLWASAAIAPLSGYAWSENVGWVQFRCPDTFNGVRLSNNIDVTGYAWSENVGWVEFSGPKHSVSIDPATGAFSGDAWSEAIGWISFNRSEAGNPPAVPYNDGTGPIARYDQATGYVTGWARALSNDKSWDGWIHLRAADNSYGTAIDAFGNFTGFAWGGDVIGWLKFAGSSTICASPYGVQYDTTTGKFSGDAWSEGVGWINFNPPSPYPTSISVPSQPATMDLLNGQVSGWAQLESIINAPPPSGQIRGFAWSENTGWLKLRGADQNSHSYGMTINLNPGDANYGALSGDAWSDKLGWVSFNLPETGTPPGAPYTSGAPYIASYNQNTGQLNGWARALVATAPAPKPPKPAPPPPAPTAPQNLNPAMQVNGFAWSENIGWIEMNDPSRNYGVSIDYKDNFVQGDAWSEAVGWISFNRNETGSPPAAPYNDSSTNYIASYDPTTGNLSGWARTLVSMAKPPTPPTPQQQVAPNPAHLTGYAWSENVGWIQLNGTGSDGTPFGVSIDGTTGGLSGHAWTETLGWISFNNSDTGLPPAAPYNDSSTNYIASYDPTTGNLSGWARALDHGDNWDGWIKLNGTGYGVQVNLTNSKGSGWAWGGDVVGWIDFSTSYCLDCHFIASIANQPTGGSTSTYKWDGWIKLAGPTYGVNIDKVTGTVSGWAWGGDEIGWIQFYKTQCLQCQQGAPPPTSGLTPPYWADGTPWDGWIKLAGPTYGVNIDPTSGVLYGFAYGGDVVGWIDFSPFQSITGSRLIDGSTPTRAGKSCTSLKLNGVSASGVYWLKPTGDPAFQAFCDMTTDSGGWTLVLQNNSGVATPSPNWTNATTTNTTNGTLGADLSKFDTLVGLKYWNALGSSLLLKAGSTPTTIARQARYASFSLNAARNYALTMSGQGLEIGNSQPGMYTYSAAHTYQFSTYDADHDVYSGNCASLYSNHPWWYGACWDGNFFAGGSGYQEAPYWSGSGSDYYAYGSIWVKDPNAVADGSLTTGPSYGPSPANATAFADIMKGTLADQGWLAVGNGLTGNRTFGLTLDQNTCELKGYAWGGDPLGWVSFTCNNDNSCSTSKYAVLVNAPGCTLKPYAPVGLTLSSAADAFCQVKPTFTFGWQFGSPSGGAASQSAYQLQISNSQSFGTIEYDTGKVAAAGTTITKSFPEGTFAYGVPNYWRLKYWDNLDRASDWTVGTDTINPASHALPKVDFSWLPKKILPGKTVQFTGSATLSPASSGSTYAWTFSGGGADPVQSNKQNPEVQFTQPTSTATATLKVSDDAGACTVTKQLETGKPLPKYKEINPGTVLLPNPNI